MFTEVAFTGKLTGRVFRYDMRQPLEAPGVWEGSGAPTLFGHHRGIDEEGEPVYIRVVDAIDPIQHAGKLVRIRRAIAAAQIEPVAACPTIVRLIDYDEQVIDTHGFGEPYEIVRAVWEWGERVLLDALHQTVDDRGALADAVEQTIGAALDRLHDAGLVHSDVAPNNIIEVRGTWKLADLDNVVRVGKPVTGLPRARRYRLDGVDIGTSAAPEIDHHGLQVVVGEIRRGVA